MNLFLIWWAPIIASERYPRAYINPCLSWSGKALTAELLVTMYLAWAWWKRMGKVERKFWEIRRGWSLTEERRSSNFFDFSSRVAWSKSSDKLKSRVYLKLTISEVGVKEVISEWGELSISEQSEML